MKRSESTSCLGDGEPGRRGLASVVSPIPARSFEALPPTSSDVSDAIGRDVYYDVNIALDLSLVSLLEYREVGDVLITAPRLTA